MTDSGSIHLKRLHGRLGEVIYEFTRMQFSPFSPPQKWSPPLNVYRCEGCLVVCADLAGVDRSAVKLQVEPRRLLIRGTRAAPEPAGTAAKPVQVLAMEIDYGVFQREVLFPTEVETSRVAIEQDNGLLWIYLPLQPPA
jgi:HSP20 family protein